MCGHAEFWFYVQRFCTYTITQTQCRWIKLCVALNWILKNTTAIYIYKDIILVNFDHFVTAITFLALTCSHAVSLQVSCCTWESHIVQSLIHDMNCRRRSSQPFLKLKGIKFGVTAPLKSALWYVLNTLWKQNKLWYTVCAHTIANRVFSSSSMS